MKPHKSMPLILSYLLLIIAALIIIGPLIIMMLISLKSHTDFLKTPLALPHPIFMKNYLLAWINGEMLSNAGNSVLLTGGSIVAIISTGALGAFAVARIRIGRLAKLIFAFFIAGLILPGQVGLIPLFMQMQKMGLYNTQIGLILIYTSQSLPITVFIFTKFYNSIPFELDESAKMDGAGSWTIFYRIIFPLVLPATVTNIIFNMIGVWNDFFTPLIFTSDASHRTLPLGLVAFKGQFSTDWPQLFAASTMIAIPVLVLYIILQRFMIDGLTAGAVKG
ncbi:carbohydrate ABC transporter permease [Paenibacillus psychroresistens]|uniref:Carbohydrate ABC transporter permease n=1 Tax=Paenibacillus psychroresistens TaxID=1778678 RepID=A0A6B8RIB5_9BACL|nr:carbohydrate ABC transporter permease [Paenibacillus psychroresistens]QGQ95126.1 carbohydrate ABC transporter permease [Paenibacillus psychroresistens]